jgi:chaperonin cofactor prefoldin
VLALIGFFLWWAVVLTYVTHKNRQQSIKIKILESQQKKYMEELSELKQKIYGQIQREETKEAEKREGFNAGY